jgi:hypothetical protein
MSSLPNWIAIGVSVAAVGVSILSLRDARISRKRADELHDRDVADRKSRAARQIDVYWGHDREAPGQADSFAVIIHNRGDESVYDFRAETDALPQQRALPVEVLPPGWWRARYFPLDESKPFGFGYVKPVDPDRFSLAGDKAHKIREYTFTDASGVKWISENGAPPVRVSEL